MLRQQSICGDYEQNLKRQTDLIDDLRKKVARLERQNDVLEKRFNDKDRDLQEAKRRADEAALESKRLLQENVRVSEELSKKEGRLQATVATIREVQVLLKSAEAKIESQKKESSTDKQLVQDLRQMNSDLKNKFEGLLALRRRTERDCALNEGKVLEKQKANTELELQVGSAQKKLDEANDQNEQLKRTIEKVAPAHQLLEELDLLANQDERARHLLNHKQTIESLKHQNAVLETKKKESVANGQSRNKQGY